MSMKSSRARSGTRSSRLGCSGQKGSSLPGYVFNDGDSYTSTHGSVAFGALAQHAGYQMKRGALKPLIIHELEPGQAIEWVPQVQHPFSELSTLPDQLVRRSIHAVTSTPQQVLAERVRLLTYWEHEALLWDTLVGHSCGSLLQTLLWDTLVGDSYGTLL